MSSADKTYVVRQETNVYTHRTHVIAVVMRGDHITRSLGTWEVYGPLTRRWAFWRASRAVKHDKSLRKAYKTVGR